jgi:hypothetical protein
MPSAQKQYLNASPKHIAEFRAEHFIITVKLQRKFFSEIFIPFVFQHSPKANLAPIPKNSYLNFVSRGN